MIKSVSLGVALLCLTFSCPASALPQDIGGMSCDVILDYVDTSPAYSDVFRSYLEGFLAGESHAGTRKPDDRDVTALMSGVVAYCASSRDATFASAVAASLKK
jgi:hypothetical protein